jgi:hypothetical protein
MPPLTFSEFIRQLEKVTQSPERESKNMDVGMLRDAQLKIADAHSYVVAVRDDADEKGEKFDLLDEVLEMLEKADTQLELAIQD